MVDEVIQLETTFLFWGLTLNEWFLCAALIGLSAVELIAQQRYVMTVLVVCWGGLCFRYNKFHRNTRQLLFDWLKFYMWERKVYE